MLNEEEQIVVKQKASLFNIILIITLCIYHLAQYLFYSVNMGTCIYIFLVFAVFIVMEFIIRRYDYYKSDFLYTVIKMAELTLCMMILLNTEAKTTDGIAYILVYNIISCQTIVSYDITETYYKIVVMCLNSIPMAAVMIIDMIVNDLSNFYVLVFIVFILCQFIQLNLLAVIIDVLYSKINSLNGIARVNRAENDTMKATQAKLLHTNEQLSLQKFKLQEANEQIIRNSEEMQLQNSIMKNLTTSLDIEEMLKITVETVIDGLKCDFVNIGIISTSENGEESFVKYSRYTAESGIDEKIIKNIESKKFIKECYDNMAIIDISNYANVKFEYISESNIKSIKIIPEVISENAYCVFSFGSSRREFFEKNKTFINNLCNQIILATSNSLLYMKMRMMAIKDPLTGIYNRRYFNGIIKDFKNDYIDRGRDITVVLFDIDKFKNINDTYGHIFGDAVISFCGKTANKYARMYDGFPVRYGGEEFVIVYTDKSTDEVKNICDQMHNEIKTKEFKCEDEKVFINISVGIASYPTYCSGFEELVNAADSAMYSSKKNGRGRITVFEDM